VDLPGEQFCGPSANCEGTDREGREDRCAAPTRRVPPMNPPSVQASGDRAVVDVVTHVRMLVLEQPGLHRGNLVVPATEVDQKSNRSFLSRNGIGSGCGQDAGRSDEQAQPWECI
jgi:hypothetical protein